MQTFSGAQHFMSSVGISLKPKLMNYTDSNGNSTMFVGGTAPFIGNVGVHMGGSSGIRFGRYEDPRAKTRNMQQNKVEIHAGDGISSKKPIPASKGGSISKKGQTYDELKSQLLQSGALFEDPEFPATQVSIDYQNYGSGGIVWKRPKEIVDTPQFISGGTSRFDVQQGALGDCWLLAAVANISLYQDLLDQVVPPEQSFDKEYCGLFKFHFWQYGEWIEVIIDDRLPCDKHGLVYMHSHDKNEFWSALLEKAYAKLFGAYDALKGGSTIEALEDFTGGLAEMYDLGAKTPPDLQKIMTVAYKHRSMMACSIGADPNVVEAIQANGLIKGHAYSITKVATIDLPSGKTILVRVRNPWGNQNEWKGRWSDGSREWNQVTQQQREELGLTFDDDGEFWMSFDDWSHEFEKLEMCCLGPQSLASEDGSNSKVAFEMTLENGSWCSGSSAGGCRNFLQTFWMNPQFRVHVEDADDEDDDDKGTLIVGLMQKNRRKLRQQGGSLLTIGFMVYKLKDTAKKLMDMDFFKFNAAIAKSNSFINTREVTGRFRVPPGDYVIVPSTFQPNEQADFLMRIFSEKVSTSEEMDDAIGIVDPPPSTVPEPINQAQTDALKRAFDKVCGEDGAITADELVDILNVAFTKELGNDVAVAAPANRDMAQQQESKQPSLARRLMCCTAPNEQEPAIVPKGEQSKKDFAFEGFTLEACRTLIAMMDVDRSGSLDFDEFKQLWEILRLWKNAFKTFDVDRSGSMSTFELRNAINQAGYTVDNATFAGLVVRFSNRDRVMHFDEYITCMARLRTAFEVAMSGQSHTGSPLLNIMIHL